MRAMVFGVFAALLVTAVGLTALKLGGFAANVQSALSAMVAGMAACVLAMTPMALIDRRSQAAVMQAALVATVIHMLVFVLAVAAALIGHLSVGPSFLPWIGAQYPATLLAIVAGMIWTFNTISRPQSNH